MVQNNAFATSAPNLGTADSFGVLGSSTVTNTGPTIITGDLGLSPGTSIIGFPPGTVTGTIHTTDPTAAQAQINATTAYDTLSSATCTTFELPVTDIGGQTLTPKVYCFPSSAAITGTLTLSGSGVYIFKIGTTLTTASSSKIVLINGASASNIFWQVGSDTTLGTTTAFNGTIIAYSSITANTGATVDGRLIALNGAVTLDTNNITVPVGVTLSSIAITTQATQVSFTIGDTLDITGLVVTGTFSDNSISVVTPNSVTGFNSSVPLTGQVLTIHVGSQVTTYTIDVVAAPPVTTDLGTADSFGVLGSSTVTNTGPTIITGDLGLSPGTSITGFPPGTVTGTIHTTDPTAAQAQINALTMYGVLSSATCTTFELPVADIGGQTLTPGVYCFPSSAAITGTLTLSGSGIYIFKIGTTLDTAAGPGASNVVLINGASAPNIFWKVGSDATLGTYSDFKGTIITLSSITANTGATIDGRLIALNGAVTLDSNNITVPLALLHFRMSESPTPPNYHPSLGGVKGQTYSDGLKINGHVFDVSKFHSTVPQQVLPLDKPATIAIKQGLTRGSPFWQHVMIFMNFGTKDTKTGNADTWISIDKNDGVQVNDPNGFVTKVSVKNDFVAYGIRTTFTFTPVKQMSDSNVIIRVWDNQLRQIDAYVDGAIVLGDVPTPQKPMQKPDWIKVFSNLKDADNAVESAGFKKPILFAHISTTSQVWTEPNTGHVLWFFDTKNAQVALINYDANGNMVKENAEQLVKVSTITMGKDTSYAGNHLSSNNVDEMNLAKSQQEWNAIQTMERLGYHS